MKILVLMPLDERYVYASWGLYKQLSEEAKEKTFNMLGFVDYLHLTKKGPWNAGVGTALKVVDNMYESYDIIFGNINKSAEFDVIFNLTDGENEEPYDDKTIKKMEEELAVHYDLHTADESKFCLVNFEAAGRLISKLYTDGKISEEKIKNLKEEYERKLEDGEIR